MLDEALLAAVAAVAREGSFERAARVLHVTPSAVSQRVKLLEERLGAVLIVRGQPCSATEIGARICRHAELVSVLVSELRRELPMLPKDSPDAAHASLRIAVNADSLGTWFIHAMAEFGREDAALLNLTLADEDHTAEWLRRGHVLGAVTSVGTAVQGCRIRRLGSLRYVATASPGFVRRWFPAGVLRRRPGPGPEPPLRQQRQAAGALGAADRAPRNCAAGPPDSLHSGFHRCGPGRSRLGHEPPVAGPRAAKGRQTGRAGAGYSGGRAPLLAGNTPQGTRPGAADP